MSARRPALAAVALVAVAGCADDGPAGQAAAVIVPSDRGRYDPAIDTSDFVTTIDNPYLPLTVGSRWVYEGVSDGERERTEVVVTAERRIVMGVEVTVVRDTVEADGVAVEDTFDWFAQDRAGNVWYFGEAVQNFEAGRLADTDGSWEAGVDGALPGIVMLADPTVGEAYRQEFYPGEAEDLGEVIAVGGRQDVRAGRYDDVVTTRDWNPLEPTVVEEKQYAPGVGLIRETHVAGGEGITELVEFMAG